MNVYLLSCKLNRFNAPTYHVTFHTSDLDDWLGIIYIKIYFAWPRDTGLTCPSQCRNLIAGLFINKLGRWRRAHSFVLSQAKAKPPLNKAFVPIALTEPTKQRRQNIVISVCRLCEMHVIMTPVSHVSSVVYFPRFGPQHLLAKLAQHCSQRRRSSPSGTGQVSTHWTCSGRQCKPHNW